MFFFCLQKFIIQKISNLRNCETFHWIGPLDQFILQGAMSVSHGCVRVCLSVLLRKPHSLVDWKLLIEEHIDNIGIPLIVFWFFAVSMTFCVLNCFRVFGSLRTSLLCLREKLAGGGSSAVAVAISMRWQVTVGRWNVTRDLWNRTHYMWHVTTDAWHVTPDAWNVTHDLYLIYLKKMIRKRKKYLKFPISVSFGTF